MSKKIGVVLSGCGFLDGAEIHEAVLTLAALDKRGAEIVCMAPDREQMHVVDHLTGEPSGETRNVLRESARIARGEIKNVTEVNPGDLDAVVLPGGFGAAKNLSTFATEGPDCSVDPGVSALLKEMHGAGKPIVALCIAPAVLAKVFGADLNPEVTIGTDAGTAEALEKMGAKHHAVEPTEVVVDKKNRMITTPCYMSATRVNQIAVGADKAVGKLMEMLG